MLSDPNPSPTPSPTGKPRRRPAPGVGGNWVWLVILLLLGGMFLASSFNSTNSVEYSDFLRLLDEEKNEKETKYLKKITFVGNDRLLVEVKDKDKLPDKIKAKVSRGKFTVERLRVQDEKSLVDRI